MPPPTTVTSGHVSSLSDRPAWNVVVGTPRRRAIDRRHPAVGLGQRDVITDTDASRPMPDRTRRRYPAPARNRMSSPGASCAISSATSRAFAARSFFAVFFAGFARPTSPAPRCCAFAVGLRSATFCTASLLRLLRRLLAPSRSQRPLRRLLADDFALPFFAMPTTLLQVTASAADCQSRPPDAAIYAAFSSVSSDPSLRQSHSMQRSVMPRLVSFLRTNFAWQIGHGCGMGLSHATKSHCFFAQFEQP